MHLNVTTTGDGERHVALVHGLGADGGTWRPIVDRLVATGSYTVTTLDLRGHGESDRASSYRLDEFADDVASTLPTGLHGVVGHSLGGSVLVRAVGRLRPRSAVYLDPGFSLALPTTGLGGRLFWAAPTVTMGVAALARARKDARLRAGYDDATRASLDEARARFDSRMATGVFRDVAHHPVAATAPTVPSVIVLSDDSPAVVPERLVSAYQQAGWRIRRLPGVHHDMQLEAPDRTAALLAEVL